MAHNLNLLRHVVRWGIYPFSWICIVAAFGAARHGLVPYQQAWLMLTGFLAVFYVIMERIVPYEQRWQMTWASFKADFRFIATDIVFLALLNLGLGFLTIQISTQNIGPATQWPLWVQLPVCLLVFEGFNYTIHRAMHEAPGAFGAFLWRVHAAHHLPEKVYVVMHAVFHPLNAVLIQALALIVPIWFAGYDQRVVTLFLMINSMHGLISHFNVDVRMGWANYVFVGTELHRFHHSADAEEGKNYGATLSIYDSCLAPLFTVPERLLHSLAWRKAPVCRSRSNILR